MFPFYSCTNSYTYSSLWFVTKTQKAVQQSQLLLDAGAGGDEVDGDGKCTGIFASGVLGKLWTPLFVETLGQCHCNQQELLIGPIKNHRHFRNCVEMSNSVNLAWAESKQNVCAAGWSINVLQQGLTALLVFFWLPNFENFLGKKP